MSRTPHPLYLRVSEARRWNGPLSELLPVLRSEAWKLGAHSTDTDREADRDWAWRVLPGGAIVGLRVRGDLWMRREIRIARQERPEGERAAAAWEREVSTFLEHFGIRALDGQTPAGRNGWLRQPRHPNDEAKGVAAVRFLELRAGEIRPGRAFCYDCVQETGQCVVVEWTAGGGIDGQRCMRHATAAGHRDFRQRQLAPGGLV